MDLTFSLVVGTKGRTDELSRLLHSLAVQRERVREVVIVDQNPDDRLEPILGGYRQGLPLIHERSEPGISRARNVGIGRASGDVIAFPDDDCTYPAGVLDRVAESFAADDVDVVCGLCVDAAGKRSHGRRSYTAPRLLTRGELLTELISVTMFFRRRVIADVGGFDPSLGVGSGTLWGSGEETDYALRAYARGFAFRMDPAIRIQHPRKTPGKGFDEVERASSYGRGYGAVLRKNRVEPWHVASTLVRPLGGMVLSLIKGNRIRYLTYQGSLLGRAYGYTRWQGKAS